MADLITALNGMTWWGLFVAFVLGQFIVVPLCVAAVKITLGR